MAHLASITLGTNIGDKILNIKKALEFISEMSDIKRISNYYETEPWGYKSENSFINLGILLETRYSPTILLDHLKQIEKKMGRERTKSGYQDRIIDLDILTFDKIKFRSIDLIIPHPKIAERKFSIVILKDLFDDEVIPGINRSAQELLYRCKDTLKVHLINEV